ncbi:tRNA modification GTPase [Blastomyces dermatitidis ATCC 18188]|uniref:tRNA modification GTPase n=1 Tax=Ajellomyces dermatitidis (strain ATCC 18188 / CBS 674.68) TaxID=653446 RepID=F2TK19_AJEDA|nr:tRNA modification GTPase [Blastomyces dermatitidis ATCC 18188]
MRRHFLKPRRWASIPSPIWTRSCRLTAIKGNQPCRPSHLKVWDKPGLRRWQSACSVLDEPSPTIYALSTAPGRAAIAIVRISGPACVQIYNALCPKSPLPEPRVAALRTLFDPSVPPSVNSILDRAVVLHFPAPKTVTGEDILELHIHGGPAVVKAVLNAIPRCAESASSDKFAPSSIRYAEPGEFTRRAFLNDRLSLPQIEALGNTLSAETEHQRRLAIRGTNDSLAVRYERWRQQLLYTRGEMEALIDFSEDQHFDESTEEFVSSITGETRNLVRQINMHIENASKGELLRNGIKVALLGAPNAGKSSLLNRIVGREAAIVSSEEGTTRDIVDVGVDLGGYFCKFGDMAGLRSGHIAQAGQMPIGAVEQEGIRRAKARALESDVVIVVLSLEEGDSGRGVKLVLEPEVIDAVQSCIALEKHMIVAVNKFDKYTPATNTDGTAQGLVNSLAGEITSLVPHIVQDQIFLISCREAENEQSETADPGNIQTLLKELIRTFKRMSTPSELENGNDKFDKLYWEDSLGVTHRQSSNLQKCVQHLNDFLSQTCQTPDNAGNAEQIELNIDIVTAAEHLRFAADCLAKITGRGESGDVEDVLGVVFEKFCVGK